jgi:gluconolactonase
MAGLEGVTHLADGLDHPEGVTVGPDGMIYAGGEAGQVYRVDPGSGAVEQIADTGGYVLGLCLDAAGVLYVCDAGRGDVLRIDPGSGAVDVFCDSAGGRPFICPNWLAFAPDGSLVVSDSGPESLVERAGRMVRVPRGGGEGEVFDLPVLHFPNGFAIGPDGIVWLVESFTPRLSRVTGDGIETVAELPGVVPDGVALTADGGCIVSCYYPFRLLKVAADGSVSVYIDDATGVHIPMPTNTVFYGPGLGKLAIAGLGCLWLSTIDTPFRGVPLQYP